MSKLLNKVVLLMLFTVTILSAANIKVITKYGKTGGIAGRLNTTSDKINGRLVCQNNPTAGCDFANDPGWSDNGTPNDGGDDTYSGDLLVRTNDIFEIIAAWTWNGDVGSDDDTVTLKSTLPQGYKWEDLPGSCDATQSFINGQNLTCVRKDFDKNSVGTVSEDLTFAIRVLGSNINGAQPGDISFEISAQNATTSSDNAGVSLTVTAAPRWNLQKSRYWSKSGYTHNGETGYLIYYKYYIEVDEVGGETDDAPSYLGTESMGSDATFTFRDDLSGVSPNAKLVECKADTWSNSNDPYPYYNSSYPDRSVATPKSTQSINCTQNDLNISVTLSHVDASLEHIPTKDQVGRDLPVNRAIAAIGVIEVFVPLSDVEKGDDGVANTSDDGELHTKNYLTDFDPTAPSGNSNFGTLSESEKDNRYNFTLFAARGGFAKGYAQKHGQWLYREGGSSGWRAGDGLLTAGAEFASRLSYTNDGGVDLRGGIICDVIDANRLEIEDVIEGEERYHRSGAFDLYLDKVSMDDLEFEYASTYVDDSWLASKGGSLDVSHGADVVRECSDSSVIWYSSVSEAKQHGLKTVTKARIKFKSGKALKPGARIYAWLKHRVRAKTLDGTPLQNGDEIVNYATIKDDDYYTSWYQTSYIPHNYPTPPEHWAGDRVTFSGGKVRVKKSVDRNNFEPGQVATFTLQSSYTNDTGTSETTTVTLKDMLPVGLKYLSGTTQNANEPTIGTCADVADLGVSCSSDNQVLIWDLGVKTANQAIADISYQAQIDITAPQGTMTNYALIEAPSDASNATQRRSDVNINITIPATINLSKSVTSQIPQEKGDATIKYAVNARNGSSVTVTELDMIDILPFNGDNTIKFRDITIPRNPASNFHGNKIFKKVELIAHPHSPANCNTSADGGVKYYYTKQNPANINLSPKDTSNDLGANSIWCEGDSDGPAPTCGFSKSQVTAIRAKGPSMDEDAVCQMNIEMDVSNNEFDDIYTNSAGASATGVTLPVVSNATPIVIAKSAVGNFVWFDTNNNGIQDSDEKGINGVEVSLYKADNTLVETKQTADDENGNPGYYLFSPLKSGDYYIKVTLPQNFQVSPKDAGGDDSKDSDIDTNGKTVTFHLNPSSQDLTIDAGVYKPSSIGDTIWFDSNKNGIQDSGEDCKSFELNVKLYDINGAEVASKTTSNCKYKFENLSSGKYRVKFELPNGFKATQKSSGGDNNLDSDFDTTSLQSDEITLGNGEDKLNLDFGFYASTALGDFVWIDSNANGIQDSGEVGIEGVEIELLKGDDSSTGKTTVTDNSGHYKFENILAGSYKLKFTLPQDYTLTTKNSTDDTSKDSDVLASLMTQTITLANGDENLTWDMGVYKKGSIGDKVWIDSNNNGIQDSGESCQGVEVEVKLLDENGSLISEQNTTNCSYKFENLTPNRYKIALTLPEKYTPTKPNVGNDDSLDSDINLDATTNTIVLKSGENLTDIDMGMLKDATIGDRVWLDDNQNGIQDDGEKGVAGVKVILLKGDGLPTGKTTTTNSDGIYAFTGIKPNSYKIKVELPQSYHVAQKDSGNDDSKDSDIDPNTLESDSFELLSDQIYKKADIGLYTENELGDFVWLDKNANGIQDAQEVGIKDVKVQLLDTANDQILREMLTDENGTYLFKSLPQGEYRVKVVLPENHHISPQNALNDAQKDSDIDPATQLTKKITIKNGDKNHSIDIGLYKMAKVGDSIWLDQNNNGIQDSGESCNNLQIEVKLLDSTNSVVKTTTTNNCKYLFEDIVPNSYKITFALPQDTTAAKKDKIQDENRDSDIDENGTTELFALSSGEVREDLDAGYLQNVSIGDFVWLDANTNGIQDSGEKGVEGIKVTLLDASGQKTDKSVTTNQNGYYLFSNLSPNSYGVEVELPSGYVVTKQNATDDKTKDSDLNATTLKTAITLLESGESDRSWDMGIYALGEIGDFVWIDSNVNGIYDQGEKGLKDVEVMLLDKDGKPTGKITKTDKDGKYLFSSLKPDNYKVGFKIPTGYRVTLKDRVDESKDSDVNIDSNTTDIINLKSGDKNRDIDLGLIELKSISGKVEADITDDKEGDKPLKDVEVLLSSCNGDFHAKSTTDNEGLYRFEGLVPNCYVVTEVDPKGYRSIKDVDGENDNNITVSLTTKDIQDRDFLDAPLLNISGNIRADMDFDGDIEIESSIDRVLEGVEVKLYKDDKEIASTKSDENGSYRFVEILPGEYEIKESDPEGFDSLRDVDGENDNIISVILRDKDILDRDFDDQKTILVSGTVRVDIDGDRVVDEPLKDTLLLLCYEGSSCTQESALKTTYTDENGSYEFDGLKPGNFVIMEVDKKGYESLDDADGGIDSVIKLTLNGKEDVYEQDFEDLAIAPMFIKIYKEASKKETHIGEFVKYSISVENVNKSFNYAAVKIKDILPAGFKYEKDSAKIIRGTKKSKLKTDGSNVVEFGEFALKAKEKVTITYLLKVGTAVAKGEHTNSAVAIQNGEDVSNVSKASVDVVADPFIDNAVVVGKVFEDKNKNGIQDKGESGIPGVRLATVEGMVVESDGYGRYHIADVKSGGFGGRGKNFIIKVDRSTLPKGAKFTTENPRVYRITSGELNVIDFGVLLPDGAKPSKNRVIEKMKVKDEVVEVTKHIKLGSIYFDSDQDCIRPNQVKTLKEIAHKLMEYGGGMITIEGNTDARAPLWYNKKLSYKRALSVYKELKHYLGDRLMDKVDVVYNNCQNEVKFNPLYDWWGKKNIPRTKKECTKFGILQKDCNRLLDANKGGVK